jgi:hypothetical protein
VWGGGEVRSTWEAGQLRWREGTLVKDERKKQQRTEGLAMSLTTPSSVQKLQTALHAKAKESPDFRGVVRRWSRGLAGAGMVSRHSS